MSKKKQVPLDLLKESITTLLSFLETNITLYINLCLGRLDLIAKQVTSTLAHCKSLPPFSHLASSKKPAFPSLYVTLRLLVTCGDVEENPGPGRLVNTLLWI